MARKPKPITFECPVQFRVQRPAFEPLESVSHLDIDELSRSARAKIELGYLGRGCCRQLVQAIIRKGMVTDLTLQPCTNCEHKPVDAKLARVLDIACERLAQSADPGKKLPMPVAEFMKSPVPDTITWGEMQCIEFCFFLICFVCCRRTDQEAAEWMCGTGMIIIDDISAAR